METNTAHLEPAKEKADEPLTSHDLLAVLAVLPEDERNAAYVDANCWRWPTALAQYKEGRFDQMTDKAKMEDQTWKAMWEAIHQCTSEFGQSQAWWVIELGRTREDHAAWIANGRRSVSSENVDVMASADNKTPTKETTL